MVDGGVGVVVSYASCVKSICDISVMHLILSGFCLMEDIHQINGRWGGGWYRMLLVLKV